MSTADYIHTCHKIKDGAIARVFNVQGEVIVLSSIQELQEQLHVGVREIVVNLVYQLKVLQEVKQVTATLSFLIKGKIFVFSYLNILWLGAQYVKG